MSTALNLERHELTRTEHLRLVPLFADIKDIPAAVSALATLMKERTYKGGDNIIREGDSGAEMFLLVQGEAAVFKKTPEGEEYKVVILGAEKHPFFGEGGLLDSDTRSATIRAQGECHCLVLDRDGFGKFSSEHPEWALPIVLRIARTVMSRVRKANDDLMLLYNALVAEIRGG
jgi:CRP-like cAMP-binding protein